MKAHPLAGEWAFRVVMNGGRFRQLDITQGIGRNVGLLLHCTCCRSSALDMPIHPRGDDAVECRACGEWFTYGELERAAATETRSLLMQSFPFLAPA
jgi:hypothetical protein